MKIIDVKCFNGRNIYSHKPIIKSTIELENLFDTPTKSIQSFNENLILVLPGLSKHHCSLGYEGGFLERLKEGTYLAHVVEHITLELQGLIGYDVNYGQSRLLKFPSVYTVSFQFFNEKLALECLITAVNMVNSLIRGDMPDYSNIIKRLWKVDSESGLGPSTKAIFEEAKKRGIPVTRVGNESMLRLGYGKYTRYIEASLTDSPNCLSIDIAGNKHLTKSILSGHGLPVPFGDVAYTPTSAVVLADMVGYPVVVKPFDANQGKGVTLDIWDEETLIMAFEEAVKFSRAVIVESYISGRDYRLLVVGGKVVAGAERNPPFIVGDGLHSIRELVQMENENPLRGYGHEKPLTKINLDTSAARVLLKNGYDFDSIPSDGCRICLRENGNLSTGGTARDCTEEIHPINCAMAVKAAQLLGLDVAGIDITAPDISKAIDESKGAIIEVNAAPGLRMHLFPSTGKARNVAGEIVDMLYPCDSRSDIPIVSITGTNGKTTVARLVSHTLALDGRTVGLTSTSGIYIGCECISKGDDTGPVGAQTVLSDKRVEMAVLETARGGLIRRGLGYDLADVGVVLNVNEDHLGLDGVDTLEDLAQVKALVVEAVKKDGYAVLNADDIMTPFMLERIRCKTILFTMEPSGSLVKMHAENGGRLAYIKGESIYIKDCENDIFVIKIDDIPITFNRKARCNIENSLAAVSALYALSVPLNIIRSGLRSFKPDNEFNPGRFNMIDFNDFLVVLDYGHNPAAYSAVAQWMRGFQGMRFVGVIAMPGDRSDASIMKVGAICSKIFSHIYIKEDKDLRGREQGETAGILYNSVISGGFDSRHAEIMNSEAEAVERAILDAQEGDMIIVFYECYDEVMQVVMRMKSEIIDRNLGTKRLRLQRIALM